MPSLRVIYRSSILQGRELSLEDAVVRIGRDPSCQVPFDENADRIVSRVHAEIRWEQTGPVLVPNQGRVVILRKKKLVGPTPLTPGDILELAGPGGPSIEIQFDAVKHKAAVIGAPGSDASSSNPTLPAVPRFEPSNTQGEATIAPVGAVSSPPQAKEEAPEQPPQNEPMPAYNAWRAFIIIAFVLAATASLAVSWIRSQAKSSSSAPNTPVVHSTQASKTKVTASPAPPVLATTDATDGGISIPPPDPSIRHIFATMRKGELSLISSTPSPSVALKAQVRAEERDYIAALKAKHLGEESNATVRLIHATARRLGECDGAMPIGFFEEAMRAVRGFTDNADAVQALTKTIRQARKAGTLHSIMNELVMSGLPPELVLIPLQDSGLQSAFVKVVATGTIAKGMWQLDPMVARQLGLQIGVHPDRPVRDPSDQRLQFLIETRKVAQGLRPVFAGAAGGSALLLMATYDHGQTGLLQVLKGAAGLKPDETDPDQVSFWRLYESGAVPQSVQQRALRLFTLATVLTKPERFGLNVAPLFPSRQ